jgi:hypothetical protein
VKVIITTCAISLLFSIFTLFQYDSNQNIKWQERIKWEADNASDVAALYYDQEQFSLGMKVFNKIEGNKAAGYILKNNLDPDGDGVIQDEVLSEKFEHYVYFFDGTGIMTSFKGDEKLSENPFEFPYLFKEPLTGYEQMIYEATVVVTIDAGKFDYRLSFIEDPRIIRISGHEYVKIQ